MVEGHEGVRGGEFGVDIEGLSGYLESAVVLPMEKHGKRQRAADSDGQGLDAVSLFDRSTAGLGMAERVQVEAVPGVGGSPAWIEFQGSLIVAFGGLPIPFVERRRPGQRRRGPRPGSRRAPGPDEPR